LHVCHFKKEAFPSPERCGGGGAVDTLTTRLYLILAAATKYSFNANLYALLIRKFLRDLVKSYLGKIKMRESFFIYEFFPLIDLTYIAYDFFYFPVS